MTRSIDQNQAPRVDAFGKLTVSLGGRCPLACKHCYTTVPSFRYDRKRGIGDVIDFVASSPSISVVCLSGDTDPMLRPHEVIELLHRLADDFPEIDLMYTTRLLLNPELSQELLDISNTMAKRNRLLMAAISLISYTFPNQIEDPRLVPSSADRLAALAWMADSLQPVALALRPTLPFGLVPKSELEAIFQHLDERVKIVLGEVLLLDALGNSASLLGLAEAEMNDVVDQLSFINQGDKYRKRSFPDEEQYIRRLANDSGRFFFMRSITAVRFLKSYWDFSSGMLQYSLGDPVDISAEGILP